MKEWGVSHGGSAVARAGSARVREAHLRPAEGEMLAALAPALGQRGLPRSAVAKRVRNSRSAGLNEGQNLDGMESFGNFAGSVRFLTELTEFWDGINGRRGRGGFSFSLFRQSGREPINGSGQSLTFQEKFRKFRSFRQKLSFTSGFGPLPSSVRNSARWSCGGLLLGRRRS
jgi:hypothetical protein